MTNYFALKSDKVCSTSGWFEHGREQKEE